jgi:hypothetical protein
LIELTIYISASMDETGWGHDLGFAKKPMVLAPMKEEQNVYYRACVIEVNRQRKTVRSLLAASAAREGSSSTARLHYCCNSTALNSIPCLYLRFYQSFIDLLCNPSVPMTSHSRGHQPIPGSLLKQQQRSSTGRRNSSSKPILAAA